MVKILLISASHRKGNSEYALNFLSDRIKTIGLETEVLLLRNKRMKLCDGYEHDSIVKGDDVASIAEKIIEADLIIFATPVYYDSISSILKILIERLDPVVDDLEGKKVASIVIGGYDKSSIREAEGYMMTIFGIWGVDIVASLILKAGDPDDIETSRKLQKKLAEFAVEVSRGSIG